jgi:hypothetical protein
MPGTALVLIVSYLMAKSTPWEMQRSVQPVSKKLINLSSFLGSTYSHWQQGGRIIHSPLLKSWGSICWVEDSSHYK